MRAFRAMAVVFALGTGAVAAVFAYEIVDKHQIRTGLLLIALITGAATFGLWTRRAWGRGLGLFVTLANAGLGAVALLGAIGSHRGGKVVPVILLGASTVVGYLLGKPIFSIDDEH